jgi:hypothetical protein
MSSGVVAYSQVGVRAFCVPKWERALVRHRVAAHQSDLSPPPFVGDPKCFRNSDDGHLRLRQAVQSGNFPTLTRVRARPETGR